MDNITTTPNGQATLLLKENANPTALILLGPPSTGKTTVASMFDGAMLNGEKLVYRSDEFTAALLNDGLACATPTAAPGSPHGVFPATRYPATRREKLEC